MLRTIWRLQPKWPTKKNKELLRPLILKSCESCRDRYIHRKKWIFSSFENLQKQCHSLRVYMWFSLFIQIAKRLSWHMMQQSPRFETVAKGSLVSTVIFKIFAIVGTLFCYVWRGHLCSQCHLPKLTEKTHFPGRNRWQFFYHSREEKEAFLRKWTNLNYWDNLIAC